MLQANFGYYQVQRLNGKDVTAFVDGVQQNGSFKVNFNQTLTLKCPDGYTFFDGEDGFSVKLEMRENTYDKFEIPMNPVNGDYTQCEIKFDENVLGGETNKTFKHIAVDTKKETKEDPKEIKTFYTFDQSDIDKCVAANCKPHLNDVEQSSAFDLKQGDSLKLVCDSGYQFYEDDSYVGFSCYFSGMSGSGTPKNFVFDYDLSNLSVCTLKIDSSVIGNPDYPNNIMSLNVDTKEKLGELFFTITQDLISELESEQIIALKNGVEIVSETELRLDDILTLKAKEGYQFFETSDSIGFSVYFMGKTPFGSPKNFAFNYDSSNLNTCDFNFSSENTSSNGRSYDFDYLKFSTEQGSVETLGGVKSYLADKSKLIKLNADRFIYNSESNEIEDYGNFIVSALSVPFKIDSEYVLDPNQILLGDKESSVKANVLKSSELILKIGEFNIPSPNNFLDYQKDLILIAPLFEQIELDVDKVLGELIEIFISLDCYSGETYLFLKSNNLGIFTTVKQNVIKQIPLANRESLVVDGGNVGRDNPPSEEKTQCKILCKEYDLSVDEYSTPIKEFGKLGDSKGNYFKVDEFSFDLCDNSEENEILSLKLKGGVFIND